MWSTLCWRWRVWRAGSFVAAVERHRAAHPDDPKVRAFRDACLATEDEAQRLMEWIDEHGEDVCPPGYVETSAAELRRLYG